MTATVTVLNNLIHMLPDNDLGKASAKYVLLFFPVLDDTVSSTGLATYHKYWVLVVLTYVRLETTLHCIPLHSTYMN